MRIQHYLFLIVTLLGVFVFPVSADKINEISTLHNDLNPGENPTTYSLRWSSNLLEAYICHDSARVTEMSVSISHRGFPESPFDKRLSLSVSNQLAEFVNITPTSISQVSLDETYTFRVTMNRRGLAEPGIYSGKIMAVLESDKTLQSEPTLIQLNPLSVRVTISESSGDTSVVKANNYPVRIARSKTGTYYVSNTNVGSVFIYDSNLQLTGELKGFNQPLSVAVDRGNKIWVGDNGSDALYVYCETGTRLFSIENAGIQMPSDMTFDRDDNIYVVDSLSDTIMVFDNYGNFLRNIGSSGDNPGELKFPSSLCIAYRNDTGNEIGEIYVADQGHGQIQVFLLDGTYVRSFGEPTQAFSDNWEGKFSRVQGLTVIDDTMIHALDCYQNQVQIFDGLSGAFISAYGTYGTAADEMNLPLDLLITPDREVIITNSGNSRVDNIHTIP